MAFSGRDVGETGRSFFGDNVAGIRRRAMPPKRKEANCEKRLDAVLDSEAGFSGQGTRVTVHNPPNVYTGGV